MTSTTKQQRRVDARNSRKGIAKARTMQRKATRSAKLSQTILLEA